MEDYICIYLCKKYDSLAWALRYIELDHTSVESYIVWKAVIKHVFPKKIMKDYNVIIIPSLYYNNVIKLFKIVTVLFQTYLTRFKIRKLISKTDKKIMITVFTDTTTCESSLIEYFTKKYPDRVEFTLMPDGQGLYSFVTRHNPYLINRTTTELFYRILGLSSYALDSHPYGINPGITRIIADHPDAICEKLAILGVNSCKVEKSVDIFTPELSTYLCDALAPNSPNNIKYDFCFLTQPIQESYGSSVFSRSEMNQWIEKIVGIASKYGKVLIKKHPRDSFDYSFLKNGNVEVCSENLRAVPFECLMNVFGYPQLISFFSSTSNTSCIRKPHLYLWKAVGLPEEIIGISIKKESENHINFDSLIDFENYLHNTNSDFVAEDGSKLQYKQFLQQE